MTGAVKDVLRDLDVKYTLLCGDLEGYGKIWPLQSKEEVQAILSTGYSQGEENDARNQTGARAQPRPA